jgi:Ca-activated chloride channel family protein
VLVAALAGSLVAVRLVGSSPSRPQPPCPGPTTTISVGADPSALRWLSALAKNYNAAHRQLSGTCLQVAVREMTARQALQALQPVPFPGGGPPPDVWVPESSTALQLVRARAENRQVLPATGAPIASSPIVVAAPGDAIRAIAAKLPAGQTPRLGDYLLLSRDPAGWGQERIGHEEWGRLLFSTADPSRSTLGASMLVAAAGAVTGTPPPEVSAKTFGSPEARQGLLQFIRSVGKIGTSGQALLAGASNTPSTQDMLATYGLVAAYEQDVWQYNGGTPAVLLQATYPLGGALAADYPYVVPNASWVSGLDRRAAADFHAWLVSPAVQNRLGSYGLRRANGTAGGELTAGGRGVDPTRFAPQPLRVADGVVAGQAAWRLLNQRVATLALVDASGSMADPVPGTNSSKLGLAIAAAEASLPLFDNNDRIGLWEFSSKIDGDRDYRELVPLGPAGGKVGGVDRRQASVAAYSRMRPLTGTGLYDSVLAVYQAAQAAYQRGYVSSVVLLTDGRNDDQPSIGLDRLLSELKKRYSLQRPVHIITIAYGADADNAVLARLARATEGLSFTAPDPREIGKVFLTAMSALTT